MKRSFFLYLTILLSVTSMQFVSPRGLREEGCKALNTESDGCVECMESFYLSSLDQNCYRCSTNCSRCNEYQCNECFDGYFLDSNSNCIENSSNSIKSERQLLILEEFLTGCHYTCETCTKKDSDSFCVKCPQSRYLDSFSGMDFGRCLCLQNQTMDTGEPTCSDIIVGIDSLNIFSYLIQGLFIPAVIITSIFGANASFLFMLLETAQAYNMLLYINSHNTGNMDSFLESFKFSHLDKYFPPIVNQVYQYVWPQQPISNNPKILYDRYNSDNTLTNNWMYLSLMTIIGGIALVLNKINPDYSSNEQSIIKWRKFMTFSVPLVYFYITFQSVFMQIIYTFSSWNNTNSLGNAGLSFSFLVFFFLIGVAGVFCFIYLKQIHQEKYYFFESALVSESIYSRLYLIWQFFKKIMVAAIVVGMYESPTAQTVILFLLYIIDMAYIQIFKPIQKQNKPSRIKIGIIHQSLLITIHMFFVIKQSISSNFGFDFFIAILMLIDLLMIGVKGISISIRAVRKYLKEQFQQLQNDEEVHSEKPIQLPPVQLEPCNISLNLTGEPQKQQNITIMHDNKKLSSISTNNNHDFYRDQ